MKFIRNLIFAALLLLLCLLLLRAADHLRDPGRVWVGGVELKEAGEVPVASGEAFYDPLARTLTLTDAVISGDFRGAAIYAEGDLTLLLTGANTAAGGKNGCTVLGDLIVSGTGSLSLAGKKSGASVRGCVTVFDSASVLFSGARPLRWGKLHISPLDTLLREDGELRVCPPDTVILTDGAFDAAGNPLLGAPYFESLLVRAGEPVTQPADPVREGYWFGGWYADPELSLEYDFAEPHRADETIYARWIRIVTLRWDSWGGSEVEDALYAWGDVPAPGPSPLREGYRFAGWYGDDRLSELYDWTQPLVEDREVYAKWEKIADITLFGIDAARYQGEVDWEAVKAGGVSFVFLRIGYRGYGSEGLLNPDDNFETNYESARAAGLDVGVYFFSQAVSEAEAVEEARYVLELLDGRWLDLPVVMDYELASDASGGLLGRLYDAGLDGAGYAAACLAFCAEVEQNGYTAAVYAGNSMLRDTVGEALTAAGYPVWLAHWTVQTRYNGAYDYWQYSGSGHVSGIDPEVDLDLRYVTAPPQVTGGTARRGSGRNVVSWDRIPGVQGYIVYRSIQDGGFAEAARCSGASSTEFLDMGADERCRYMICAVLRVDGGDLRGVLSEIVSVTG
jgi:uncharacterized repeat protein (TIGR02543 family)